MNNSIEDFLTITNNGLDVDANNVNANCITSKNNTFSMDTSGNLICNSITTNVSSGLTFNQIYPIGSIYISVANTNPGTLFTGTWEKIEGKFLLASSTSYSVGSTGGEANHTLTINEMPNHSHGAGAGSKFQVYEGSIGFAPGNYYTRGNQNNTGTSGGGQAHNNMPPYLSVNIWKRIS
jgi:hypothetical protein